MTDSSGHGSTGNPDERAETDEPAVESGPDDRTQMFRTAGLTGGQEGADNAAEDAASAEDKTTVLRTSINGPAQQEPSGVTQSLVDGPRI